MKAYFNLLKRQWSRGRVDESGLQLAVEKGYITNEQKEDIVETEF